MNVWGNWALGICALIKYLADDGVVGCSRGTHAGNVSVDFRRVPALNAGSPQSVQRLHQRRAKFIRVEPKRARFALVCHAALTVNQVETVWPSGVSLLGGVTELVERGWEFDP